MTRSCRAHNTGNLYCPYCSDNRTHAARKQGEVAGGVEDWGEEEDEGEGVDAEEVLFERRWWEDWLRGWDG